MTEQSKSMFVIDGSDDVDPSTVLSETPGDIGGTLAQARNVAGLGLDQLSRDLRIRREYLEAFEQNRMEDLPSLTYATGFLRTYANALGLDPDPLVDQFKREVGQPHERTDLEFPEPIQERRLPGFSLVLISAILAALIYGAWQMMSGEDAPRTEAAGVTGAQTQSQRPAATTSEMTEESAATADRDAAAESAETRGENASAQAETADARAEEADGSKAESVDTRVGTNRADAAETPGDDVDTASTRQTAEAEANDASPAAAAAAEDGNGAATETPGAPQPDPAEEAASAASDAPRGIVLRATTDSWLRIRNAEGRTVVAHLLRAGETFQVPDEPGLTMTLGNSGGVEVTVDGRTLEPLGASGVPVHGVSLDRESLQRRP